MTDRVHTNWDEVQRVTGLKKTSAMAGLRAGKFSFGTAYKGTGEEYIYVIDDIALKLVEEKKISMFLGGGVLPL